MPNPLTDGGVPEQLQTQNVFEQGSTYEEDDFLDEDEGTTSYSGDGTAEGGSGDDDENKKKNAKGKQAVLVAVVIAVFVGVGIIVMMIMSMGSGKEEELPKGVTVGEDGTQYVEINGEQVPINPDTGEPLWIPEPPFEYMTEEIASLREAGYTGDEIEENEANEIPAQQLIDEAVKAQEVWAEQFVAPYFDTASDEFKSLMDDTWLGGTEIDLSTVVTDERTTHTETLNLDYEKVPLHGNQAFIKLHVNDHINLFMNTTIVRYMELADSGNIVVNITYHKLPDGTWYSYEIKEVGY